MTLTPTQREARNQLLVVLRSQGYTYDAIAIELHNQGFTEKKVSRVRIQELIQAHCPHLKGNIRRSLGLTRLVHAYDLKEG